MIITEEVIQYLSDRIDVGVYAEKPQTDETRYIVVEKTGGSRQNMLQHDTVAIQSYAQSMLEANRLNEEVKEAMDEMNHMKKISASRYQTDYNFTDISTKEYRYQCIYEITHVVS